MTPHRLPLAGVQKSVDGRVYDPDTISQTYTHCDASRNRRRRRLPQVRFLGKAPTMSKLAVTVVASNHQLSRKVSSDSILGFPSGAKTAGCVRRPNRRLPLISKVQICSTPLNSQP